ncbi:MAG: hypothetical protein HOP13_01285, partial [Alphaproteobacteria bacterium]|nr:hypothetical protein [Alphaproteobacteria bacterium]
MLRPSTLAVVLFAALFTGLIARANDAADELQGIWVSRTPFDRPAGELVVHRAEGGWTAALGQRQVAVEIKGKDLRFRFPDGQGAFRGRLIGDRRIDGFWIQEGVSDQPFASPLTLHGTAAGGWRGEVPQLGLGFTLYLKIFRREDGVLIGAFRNPEINTRGGASRFYVQRQR